MAGQAGSRCRCLTLRCISTHTPRARTPGDRRRLTRCVRVCVCVAAVPSLTFSACAAALAAARVPSMLTARAATTTSSNRACLRCGTSWWPPACLRGTCTAQVGLCLTVLAAGLEHTQCMMHRPGVSLALLRATHPTRPQSHRVGDGGTGWPVHHAGPLRRGARGGAGARRAAPGAEPGAPGSPWPGATAGCRV